MSRVTAWDVRLDPSTLDPDHVQALADAADQVVHRHAEHYVSFLCGLLRFRTVSGQSGEDEKALFEQERDACLGYLRIEAERQGLDFRVHDGIAAVAERPGSGSGSVGVAAHVDVVPVEESWRYPPFAGAVVDGEIWGRGAQDDKGPVAAAFAALDVLRILGLRPRKDLRLLLGTLEETPEWPDMDLLIERGEAPDVALVPDGAYPVIVGEKGFLTVEWEADWGAPETEPLRFLRLHAGSWPTVVPGTAVLEAEAAEEDADDALAALQEAAMRLNGIEPDCNALIRPGSPKDGRVRYEVRFRGREAHAAFPREGHNAAIDALAFMTVVPGWDGPASWAELLLRRCRATNAAGFGLDEAHTHMGQSTLNLGVVEADAHHVRAVANLRFPVGMDSRRAMGELRVLAADAADHGLAVSTRQIGIAHEPLYISPEDHPHLIDALCTAYRAGTGREPGLASIAGTTYAKVLPLAVGFGMYDGSAGDDLLIHRTDERVRVERFLEDIRTYAVALALLACDPEDRPRVPEEPRHIGRVPDGDTGP